MKLESRMVTSLAGPFESLLAYLEAELFGGSVI